jgi:hypothetical protein
MFETKLAQNFQSIVYSFKKKKKTFLLIGESFMKFSET